MNFLSKAALSALVVLSLVGSQAFAALSSEVTLTSDYIWRGLTQTGSSPSVQGSMDYAFESGFSTGIWATNTVVVPTANTASGGASGSEVDLYLRYDYGINEEWNIFIEENYFMFTQDGSLNSHEITLGVEKGDHSFSIGYIPNYFDAGSYAIYYNLSGSHTLNEEAGISAGLSLGYTQFGNNENVGSTNYADVLVSLSHSKGSNTVTMGYSDTTRNIQLDEDLEDNTESVYDKAFAVSLTHSFE